MALPIFFPLPPPYHISAVRSPQKPKQFTTSYVYNFDPAIGQAGSAMLLDSWPWELKEHV